MENKVNNARGKAFDGCTRDTAGQDKLDLLALWYPPMRYDCKKQVMIVAFPSV